MIPNRLKVAAATGLIIGGIGVAALPYAFAAPLPDVSQSVNAAAPVATPVPSTPAPGTPTTGTPEAGEQPHGARGAFGRGASSTALAGFFGITPTDLQSQLASGQTLAQIATAHGKTTNDLKAFLTAQLKTRLDAAVAAGRLTSQQEQDALTKSSANLDNVINATHTAGKPNGSARMGRGAGWLSPVAGFLGMQSTDLMQALQSGQTLAQVAQAHGKTTADLKAFLLDRASKQIDTMLNQSFQRSRTGGASGQSPTGATPAASPTATPNAA